MTSLQRVSLPKLHPSTLRSNPAIFSCHSDTPQCKGLQSTRVLIGNDDFLSSAAPIIQGEQGAGKCGLVPQKISKTLKHGKPHVNLTVAGSKEVEREAGRFGAPDGRVLHEMM